MKILFSSRALRGYLALPSVLRKTADKQFDFLLRNIGHPSLHAKKYDEARDVWQGRLTKGYRFYFSIEGDTYQILTIRKHPK